MYCVCVGGGRGEWGKLYYFCVWFSSPQIPPVVLEVLEKTQVRNEL